MLHIFYIKFIRMIMILLQLLSVYKQTVIGLCQADQCLLWHTALKPIFSHLEPQQVESLRQGTEEWIPADIERRCFWVRQPCANIFTSSELVVTASYALLKMNLQQKWLNTAIIYHM
jgi:hypothetical protein